MAEGYTAFITYMLVPETTGVTTQGYGYSQPIHCNYIKSIFLEDINNKEFNLYFEDEDRKDFKFLSTSGGTGFTAHKIVMLAQLVYNDEYESINDVKPASDRWAAFDVTDQIASSGYSSGQTLSAEDVTSTVFRVPIKNYNIKASNNDFYDLSYLNYPQSGTDQLSFGDETYFMGNVKASIEAIAYTMDLGVNLPLNQFNSTDNPTWNSELDEQVYISEIGLYDEDKNLVGIAKLNNPIPKDDTIARTIVFAMDF